MYIICKLDNCLALWNICIILLSLFCNKYTDINKKIYNVFS